MKARKRLKVSEEEGKAPQTAAGKPGKQQKSRVHLEHLPWKTVSMPDHLEDYEGFFGLEEIEDVEVVKEDGKISFMSTSDAGKHSNQANGVADEEPDGDEWSGFGDDDGDGEAPSQAPPQPKKSQKSQKRQPDPANESLSYRGAFESLSSETPDDNQKGESDMTAWQSLNLVPDTLTALSKLNFTQPTPIQRDAIPEILAGHDVIGKASTGSGKTLAFGIPILERFLELRNSAGQRKEKTPLALILSPTRELAHQLDKHLTALCNGGAFEGPSIATITGGLSLQKQQRLLKGADIIIGTPGRLWEIASVGQGIIESLKKIEFLVIDEADRLLSQGNFKELEEILNALDRQDEDEDEAKMYDTNKSPRQTLIFSATFDKGLQRKLATKSTKGDAQNLLSNQESMEYLLSRLNFREETPKFIDVNPINPLVTGLKESLVECPAGTDKDIYLYTLLLLLSHSKTSGAKTLVFANSISAVKRLTPFLQNLNLPALALHSGMAQKARLRSVERFTTTSGNQPSCSILVATDVAARGLDIPNVQTVLHYHLPRAADTYVHRSGRTARAGQQGSSILICAPEEVAGVRRLIAKVHTSHSATNSSAKTKNFIRTLDLNRKIVSRLRPRAALAKQLADTQIAKEKSNKEDEFMRAAAKELGVDYDSESFAAEEGKGKRGRGAGRKKKEREASGLSKAEVASLRAELNGLLKQRVNVGVSEKYLTGGGVDVDALLRQREEHGTSEGREFLGSVQGLDLEELL
ncbi:P-loop containing nucleoside triphosphate hydrolase protein [Neohortaea acidophila]|uniref:RNA helicase n=1 Tax=Neohortaea acidophila TaxID=245834 RepID=A0A6A6PRG2_9PEZI|nr:P-loop containing nucleoside triphosphate hydrolase protein [Neohortaea acidophila]KAF2482386.1 P-loop containing nucleoside triphosphate hydrolase protein [Neohortaea acidophila]